MRYSVKTWNFASLRNHIPGLMLLSGILNAFLWGSIGFGLSRDVVAGKITWISIQDVWNIVVVKFSFWSMLLVILYRIYTTLE